MAELFAFQPWVRHVTATMSAIGDIQSLQFEIMKTRSRITTDESATRLIGRGSVEAR
ncbi:hypothetical protein [Pandoraea sputorum]|uniref:hypothetical protein n=1 Tax=Pandoraea sputorum TaxID=93222 RepID=UPI0012F51441|nr:hypothetical protein [Pandoraea sputorum]